MIRAAFLALALLGFASVTMAAPPPGRLPQTVAPRHYTIDLTPDLETLRAAGTVTIEIDVREATAELVLNALDLEIAEAVIVDTGARSAAAALDGKAQTATLRFERPLSVGPHTLRIVYTARINSYGRGLFYTDYPTEAGRRRMIATQLEPADARRVFPGWDEPALKAGYTTSVTVPDSFLAVSNMPETASVAAGPGLKRVTFAPTPPMSSYLFVLVAGEMQRVSRDVDGVTIGVVATTGKQDQSGYALDSAARLLRYYNDYFDVRYPLPKLDLIALPGGFGGAMENWGGITFFETLLLFERGTTPEVMRRRIFATIAHEIAHQWFGDLVTMAWWDDLWLNEGFASWMDSKASQALNPAWPVWLDAAGNKQWTMAQDAKASTHPIQQPVSDPTELLSAFDAITYGKGRAVIRQLESYLGEAAFRAGIRTYMQTHAFGNATTADLWRALQTASGKPVAEIAASFTEQPGLPLVVLEASCPGGQSRLTLRQERLSLRDPGPHPQQWSIPIALMPLGDARADILLREKSVTLAAGRCGVPVKANSGDVGYYRVQYDDGTLAALTGAFTTLPPVDRINLLSDTWALTQAGRVSVARYLALADAVPADDHRAVWEEVIRAYTFIDFLERGRDGRSALQAFMRARLRPAFERLGWNRRQDDSADDRIMRPRLVRVLGELGDPDIIAEAKRRFAAGDLDRQRAELREPVLRLVGRYADRATYDRLLAMARKATATEERSRLYFALAGALDPALARETLGIALSDELPSNLASGLIWSVASNAEQTALAWNFAKDNLPALLARHGPTYLDNSMAYLLTNASRTADADELAQYAPLRETAGGRIAIERATDTIRTNAEIAARQLPAIEQWVAAHPPR